MNKKQTGKNMSLNASKVLNSNTSSAIQKNLLGQLYLKVMQINKHTSKQMETTASKVLQSNKYNKGTKALAGSVLSQTNKKI